MIMFRLTIFAKLEERPSIVARSMFRTYHKASHLAAVFNGNSNYEPIIEARIQGNGYSRDAIYVQVSNDYLSDIERWLADVRDDLDRAFKRHNKHKED